MKLFDCRFDSVTMDQALEKARHLLRFGERGYITTVNVAILMQLQSEPRLKEFVRNSFMTVADGQPIVWLSKLLKQPLPERVTGVDLIPGICRVAAEEGRSVFFLGAKPSVVKQAAQLMSDANSQLEIAGVRDGYFSADEAAHIASQVRQSGASVLLVGMGVPLQENFLEDHWEQLGVQLAIPIGGALDMLTGNKPRAAKWIRSIGCEWLWRLWLEPNRLAKRYLVSGFQFGYRATCELAKSVAAKPVIDSPKSDNRKPNGSCFVSRDS